MSHMYADLVRVGEQVLLEAWCSNTMAILSWRKPISMAALIQAIVAFPPAHAYREYTESDLSLAYPQFSPYVSMTQGDFIEIFREAYALRRKRELRSRLIQPNGRYVNANTIRRLRVALDAWAYGVWIRRGAPHFGRRIITGVRMGEALTQTNGMTGRRRKILSRVVGVNKVVVPASGHVRIRMDIRP